MNTNFMDLKAAKQVKGSRHSAKRSILAEAGESQRRDIKLGFLIHDVSRMRRKAFNQIIKPLGVTRAQCWVLAYLSRQDGMMQVQLADILDVGKASLGTIIERLEAGGWVERRGDPVDKRAKRIYLACNAQQLLERMAAIERDFNRRIMVNLTAADRSELIRLLSSIKESLSQMDMAAPAAENDSFLPSAKAPGGLVRQPASRRNRSSLRPPISAALNGAASPDA